MLFRQIIIQAVIAGILAGLLLSVLQLLAVNPIIIAAEGFEITDAAATVGDGHDHVHSPQQAAWAPADGLERSLFTLLSNVLAGIGFAAILLALMHQMQAKATSLSSGMLWGAAGFSALFLAPALGLPPEIPGVEAAAIEHRQSWWLLAVLSVSAGLIILAFAAVKFKIFAVALLALPYLVDIPHHQGPAFSHPDPAAVQALTSLHHQFIFASGVSNFVFWLALGVLSVVLINHSRLRTAGKP